MAFTEFVKITGKGSWIKHKMPETYGNDIPFWSGVIHPNPEGLEIARELAGQGVKNHIKKDDDGWFIKYKRPVERKWKDKSGVQFRQAMAPIEVIDKDNLPFDGLIGNGSDVTFKLEVYKHKTPGGGEAKAARLLGVKVHNLVPYESKSYTESQQRAVKGLEAVPAPKEDW